jgi:hypothetical protein
VWIRNPSWQAPHTIVYQGEYIKNIYLKTYKLIWTQVPVPVGQCRLRWSSNYFTVYLYKLHNMRIFISFNFLQNMGYLADAAIIWISNHCYSLVVLQFVYKYLTDHIFLIQIFKKMFIWYILLTSRPSTHRTTTSNGTKVDMQICLFHGLYQMLLLWYDLEEPHRWCNG